MAAVGATKLSQVNDGKLESSREFAGLGAVRVGEDVFERELIQAVVTKMLHTLLVHLS